MSQQGEQPAREAAFFTTIRSWGLTRGDHGILGGVVEGVGERIGLARVPARLIFVVIALVTAGFGVLAYAAGWALLPDRRGNIIVQNFGRGIPNVGALLGIALLTLLGIGGLPDGLKRLAPWSWSNGWPWDGGWGVGDTLAIVWWFIVVGGLTWLVIYLIRRGRDSAPSAGAQPGPAASDTAGAAAPPASEAVYAALPGEAGPAAAPPYAANRDPHPGAAQAAWDADRHAGDAQRQAQQQAWQAQQEAQRRAAEAQRQAHAAAVEARRRYRIPGPGAAGYLTALAWLILSGVGLWIAERGDLLAVHPLVAWPVAVLIGWGAILVVVSLLGRRLGFLGVLTVLGVVPVLLIGSAATGLRGYWEEDHSFLPHWEHENDAEIEENVKSAVEGWIQDNIDPEFEIDESDGEASAETGPEAEASADPEATVAPVPYFDDYSTVVLRGDCYDATANPMQSEGGNEQIALSALTSDQELSLSAENTLITIPSGTAVSIVTDDSAQLDVEWAAREVWCSVAGSDTTLAAVATDEDAPTLTLVVTDEDVMTVTINEIEE